MSTDRQVQFALNHREHFAAVRDHNLLVAAERMRGNWNNAIRNAWEELGFDWSDDTESPSNSEGA
jgi:hypothetical protein